MRHYGKSVINPEGTPEDVTRCAADVVDRKRGRSHQCRRKRGHGHDGLLCWQHATDPLAWIPPESEAK